MVKDIFAPVVKTLFIPEGNPGVREIKEIRALPRMTQAEGDDQELIISGEMDLSIRYLPINDADEDIPWRSIELKENESWNPEENEEQVISRLKSALKEDVEVPHHERFPEEVQLRITVPFSLAVDTEGLYRDHPLIMNPAVHSNNWYLVSPKAIEYEAVLQLITEEDEEPVLRSEEALEEETREAASAEPVILEEETREAVSAELEILEEEIREAVSEEPAILEEESREAASAEPVILEEETREAVSAEPEILEEEIREAASAEPVILEEESREAVSAEPVILEEETREAVSAEPVILEEEIREVSSIKPILREVYNARENEMIPLPQPRKPAQETIKEKDVRFDSSEKRSYFQIKFYRVQAGENLDDVANKFGLPRERIRTFNAVHEEEIRAGLLLSIPKRKN
jgi:hypothetical protein